MKKNFFSKKFSGKNLSRQAGFTLIEILAACGIFIIIFGVLTGFIVWVYGSVVKIQAVSEVENSFQQAMETMLREIKRSRSIYTPTSNSSQISLATINYTPLGEITSFIDFFICGEQVCFKIEGQDPVALTSQKTKVQALNFIYLTQAGKPTSVQIGLDLGHQNSNLNPALNILMTATSTASLRMY